MKPPRFAAELYADLRDRKLLPLVVALVVAIPAVPLLLGSGSEAPSMSSAVTDAVLAEDEIPTVPAVLASDAGLRDYRRRLDSLRSKNPFEQRFGDPSGADPAQSSVSEVEVTGGGGGGIPAIPGIGGDGGVPTGVDATVDLSASSTGTSGSTTTESTVTDTTTTDTSSEASGSGGDGGTGKPEREILEFRVDIEVGRAGDAERRKNVKLLTVLPSQSNPVLVFLGPQEKGTKAVFLVSDEVVDTHGSGRCLPSAARCTFLSLRVGEEHKLEYAPRGDADTYVIRLVDIRLAPIDDEGKLIERGSSRARDRARADLQAFLGL